MCQSFFEENRSTAGTVATLFLKFSGYSTHSFLSMELKKNVNIKYLQLRKTLLYDLIGHKSLGGAIIMYYLYKFLLHKENENILIVKILNFQF